VALSIPSSVAGESVSPKSRTHNLPLEGLRGLAALMVVYCHLFAPAAQIDRGYSPSPWFWTVESGHAAVVLFFVISGFVIGLTNQEPYSPARLRGYAWRRFIRLVPLYVLAIAISVAFRPGDRPGTIVANLFFLQNDLPYGAVHLPTLAANTNLWSLNFEVLYYALFVVIWKWRVPVAPLAAAAAGVACLGYFRPDIVPAFAANYAAGWVFWLSGLWLAWDVKPRNDDSVREPWPALLLLFILAWKVKILFLVMKRLSLTVNAEPGVLSLLNLDFVPISLLLVALVTQRRGRFFSLVRNLALAVPLLYWSWRLLNHTLFETPADTVNAGLTALAALLWWWRPTLQFFVSISITGFLCYGIYVFQRPVQWLVRDHLPGPQGSAASFALRVLLAIALTLLVAWFAERRLQPWLRRWLERHLIRVPRKDASEAAAP
jgi:peptidoglycan/LPS O-acetylase OafA/YrhL